MKNALAYRKFALLVKAHRPIDASPLFAPIRIYGKSYNRIDGKSEQF